MTKKLGRKTPGVHSTEEFANTHCDDFKKNDPWKYGCGVDEGGCCTTKKWLHQVNQRMMSQIAEDYQDGTKSEEREALKRHFNQMERLGSHILANLNSC